MVGLTPVVGLSFLVGALVLGLSLDLTRAVYWTVSTVINLLVQITVAEPLKVFLLALFWSSARKNIPK